jgi:hypothetical protein
VNARQIELVTLNIIFSVDSKGVKKQYPNSSTRRQGEEKQTRNKTKQKWEKVINLIGCKKHA